MSCCSVRLHQLQLGKQSAIGLYLTSGISEAAWEHDRDGA